MVVEVDGAAIAPHLERLADVARRHGVRGPTELDVVIGMDRAACPRRAIEGLRGQWEQRALLLALEDEPGDLAGGAMTRVPAVPDTRPSRAPACRRGRASAPAEEVLADVGDPALHFRFPGGVARDRGIDDEAAVLRVLVVCREVYTWVKERTFGLITIRP